MNLRRIRNLRKRSICHRPPSNQEYHIRNCLTSKDRTIYWRSRKLKRLASIGARENSASRFYWRSRKLSVSLLLALEKTQRLASIGARQVLMYICLIQFA
ncbi:hypothetical protein FHG68_09790 [Leptospira weilii]|nr:hypothetical protein FHG67_12455 [Leptospira weilii]QDK26922.1 hypothetical protein FHG68_09790 [Leptospira weilii]